MASSTQIDWSADWADLLPEVRLEARQGSARSVSYTLTDVDFLIGSVPGCDLRLPPLTVDPTSKGRGEYGAVVCLFARHPRGVSLRRLAPTVNILVNGHPVTTHTLADGDRVQIGPLEIRVHVKLAPHSGDLDQARAAFQKQVEQFREQLVRFQSEKDTFERARQNASTPDLEQRERDLDRRIKQYETDVLRLNRIEGNLERREADLTAQADELSRRREQIEIDSKELQEQLLHLDEWRVKLNAQADALTTQKDEQDAFARQLAERTAALEGQQATVTALRSRLERMRDGIRAREMQLDDERARLEARAVELVQQEQEVEKLKRDLDNDQKQHTLDRDQWAQRSAVMDAAVRQLKQAQANLAIDEDRMRRESQELDALRQRLSESDAVLQGRLTQIADTQTRLDAERQALQDRGVKLAEREQACIALQEQLHRRSEEIAARHRDVNEQVQEYQDKHAELEAKRKELEQREQELQKQIETWQRELKDKAAVLQQQAAQITGLDAEQQDQLNQLAIQRKAHADEQAQFRLEQQFAVEKLAQARAELEALRNEASALAQQLPDGEVRAAAAVDRLGQARAQLRSHLNEIHDYVRQCQDELQQMRAKLQADLDKLHEQETALRQSQDEHRLASAAFRQQLIDWQGQILDLKRVLSRDETRLQRREAQVDERAKEIDAESERLAQHAEELHEQERQVADRREEIDRHLVDMREWYRRKLRELAGIPLVPDALPVDAEPTILPGPGAEASEPVGEGEEQGIVPTGRSILSISSAADPGDQKLGQVLRDAQLIEADTLTALLAEARRQRRSLRQVLLASGVITLYQLALIEAGNVQGLMLGPVRIIDRLRHTAHETVYRVFDPRRGVEAVLRHLADGDMNDAIKPDEFRERFGQAMLNDMHVANTLEVLELAGRPAALQEWLSGLPASDWPPLAAAPGVCYRLLTQAAQGLATAHRAGLVHGHLSDSLLFLTGDGVLKICGVAEPPWLIGLQLDDDPTPRDDLRALGTIVSGWCTPTGVRKGPKTKPLPEALVSVLYRLAADGDAGYKDAAELLDDLHKASAAIPPNAEAWDRLLRYVREHGTAEALLRQSA